MMVGLGLGLTNQRGGLISRASFVARITTICGQAPVIGFLPQLTDTTTTTCPWSGKVWTADADMSAQLTAQGNGAARAFVSANSRYLSTPVSPPGFMSFGNAVTDSPVTFVALANVTNTAADRLLFSKYASGLASAEYMFYVTSADALRLLIQDQSAGAVPFRTSNAAITQGSYRLFAASYDASGGATAANGIVLYDNTLIASTATNAGTYVAMEPLSATPEIGSYESHTTGFLDAGCPFQIVVGKVLSGTDIASILATCRAYFSVPL